jgi:hypothetical protein
MEIAFDIFTDYKNVSGHKGALITKKGKDIIVEYKGPDNSAGIRSTLKTLRGNIYRLNVTAKLIKGDMGFIYCESVNPPVRLIERKYFITKSINSFKIQFEAVSSSTYIGILFYNAGEYRLEIEKFRVECNGFNLFKDVLNSKIEIVPQKIRESIRENYRFFKQKEDELKAIVDKNTQIMQDMLKEAHDEIQLDSVSETLVNQDIDKPVTEIKEEINEILKEDKAIENEDKVIKAIENENKVIENDKVIENEKKVTETVIKAFEEEDKIIEDKVIENEIIENEEKQIPDFLEKLVTFNVLSMSKLRYPKGDKKGIISVILGHEHEFHGFGETVDESLNNLKDRYIKWVMKKWELSGCKDFSEFFNNYNNKPKLPKKKNKNKKRK